VVLLRVDGVEFSYRSVEALRGVRFEVERGEVISVVGPNGSGKTTLLRVIDGILKPRRGSVYIDGRSVHGMGRRELAKVFGYVPQRLEGVHPITVLDFVVSGRRGYMLFAPTKHDFDKALEALREVGAEDRAYRRLTELSGGELQLVLIARALAAEPRVLLLDEPTANLDLRHQVEVLELLRGVAKNKGVAVVMALHDLTQAYRYSDKVVMMRRGEVYAAGKPEEVITEENVYSVYGVRVRIYREEGAVIVVGL